MMTEQTTTLSNEELQNKWKFNIKVACFAVRLVDLFTDVYNAFCEAFKWATEVLSNTFDTVKECFDNILAWHYDSLKEFDDNPYRRTRLRLYKHCDTYKVDTKGFSAPIRKCARSRC